MPSEQKIKNAAKTLIELDCFRKWSRATLEIWLHDNSKCAYCNFDLLQEWGIAYFFSSVDHLLPQSKYPSLVDDPFNMVLCCRACNCLKGTFDPNADRPSDPGRTELSPQERRYFLEVAKLHLTELREPNLRRFAEERDHLREEQRADAAHSQKAG